VAKLDALGTVPGLVDDALENRRFRVAGGCEVSYMKPKDVSEVIAFMAKFPSLHFCEWEDEQVLARALERDPLVNAVARDAHGRVIGAVLGGVLGVRGTVNHIAVEPAFGRAGIGEELLQTVLAGFRDIGIYRVFLFVVDGNRSGESFWRRMGFRETTGETTLELDL